uniref:Angiotensin I converting enzyme n=1 Tax=Stegastes partitus TaxID=144197 RepID=A0A3B4ZR84_9TELE
MGTGVDRFLWSVLLLLPIVGFSEALPNEWLPGPYENNTSGALMFLTAYNSTAEEVLFKSVSASWTYNTNITDHNSKLQVNASLEEQAFAEAWGTTAKEVFSQEVLNSLDPSDKKLMEKIMILGAANLPQQEREESSQTSWPTPGATRSCCTRGRAGTMHQVCLSRSFIPSLCS